jgi:hypothetical protein
MTYEPTIRIRRRSEGRSPLDHSFLSQYKTSTFSHICQHTMSTSDSTSNSLFEAESAIVRSDDGSEVVKLRFARPSYLRYDEVTETLYVGFSGSAFPVDDSGAFTNSTIGGLSIGLPVNIESVLSALDAKARCMSENEWDEVLKNQPDSLSILSNAMQQALGKPAVSGWQSTVNGCKTSVLLTQDTKPLRAEDCFTFAPISQLLPDTKIERREVKDGERIKQSLQVTVTIPQAVRETSKGMDAFVTNQRIINNVARSSASAMSSKLVSQLNSLAHPKCSEAQTFGVANSAACIVQAMFRRQLEFDTGTADVDDQQREVCESTQSIQGTAYSELATLVVRAAEDE